MKRNEFETMMVETNVNAEEAAVMDALYDGSFTLVEDQAPWEVDQYVILVDRFISKKEPAACIATIQRVQQVLDGDTYVWAAWVRPLSEAREFKVDNDRIVKLKESEFATLVVCLPTQDNPDPSPALDAIRALIPTEMLPVPRTLRERISDMADRITTVKMTVEDPVMDKVRSYANELMPDDNAGVRFFKPLKSEGWALAVFVFKAKSGKVVKGYVKKGNPWTVQVIIGDYLTLNESSKLPRFVMGKYMEVMNTALPEYQG